MKRPSGLIRVLKAGGPCCRKVWVNATTPEGKPGRLYVRSEIDGVESETIWIPTGLVITSGAAGEAEQHFVAEEGWVESLHSKLLEPAALGPSFVNASEMPLGHTLGNTWKVRLGIPPGHHGDVFWWRVVEA